MDKKNAGDKVNGFVFIDRMNTCGGMQTKDTNNGSIDNNRYAKEIDLLMVICSNITDENELRSKLEEFNGNIAYVTNEAEEEIKSQNEIEQVSQQLFLIRILLYYKKKKVKEIKDEETVAAKKEINENQIEKEEEKAEVGQTKPGVNLQGYCTNEDCLAAKAKFLVWIW
ncbi:hypothetical protein RFI_30082 [Reticulomyxa filosa]|uniref:Uncharacterized protein n=1 Tax=Reticulomyxa filosa TaxID=46433 RepID=X6M095_RETFI|nr:hypothetical protein RFI_30082 [Reticulomyxa filosa]|eukprot:ETO07309.1 hypothetical protein RFI_30082 [Reticulomyxa filosa]